MTNQYFTKSAVEFAKKLNVILWDGDQVMKFIHEVAIPEKKNMMEFLGNIVHKSSKDRKENRDNTVEEDLEFFE